MRGPAKRTQRAAWAIVAAMLFVALTCAPALAAYPGSNGKIAFTRDAQIWTMNPDGTNQTQLTTVSGSYDPQWSPNGSRIAYTRGYGFDAEVRIMNADGSNDVHVRGPSAWSPTWAPNGKRLALIATEYDETCPCNLHDLIEVNPDGTQPRLLYFIAESTNTGLNDVSYSPAGGSLALSFNEGDRNLYKVSAAGGGVSGIAADPTPDEFRAAWSPSANRIAYLDGLNTWSVATVNPNGTGRTVVAPNAYGAEWSPDGSKLVIASRDGSCGGCIELQVMNPDGSGGTTITHTAAEETDPDWQPVVGAPPAGYPRPKGATPLRVSLVPAFNQCMAPNRTHGPPLAFGSCNPPVQSAPDRTVGTPDFNGAAANMAGSVRLATLTGNPATATDEADVSLDFSVTDIRCRTGLTDWPCSDTNTQGGSDWSGKLVGRIPARLTDRYAVPAPGGISPGTMTDQLITFDVWCTSTTDPTIGSACSLSTTLDAIIPGMISEGDRALLELGQVEVRDDASGGLVLLRQGVFIP